jgi:uncharacterized protein YggE
VRLVAAAVALALGAALPLPAAAQVNTPPLAPGEVLLETGAVGSATVPADLATIHLAFSGTGETNAAAQADLDARYQRIVAAARQSGIPVEAITRTAPDGVMDIRTFDVVEEPPPLPEGGAPVPPPVPRRYLSGMAVVRVTNMARIAMLPSALEAAAETEPGSARPVYSLSDNRAARQVARTQALATVRADAESHAASLGIRVARIVRVTERTGLGLLPQLLSDSPALRRVFSPGPNHDPDITVFVMVGVDFALAPR